METSAPVALQLQNIVANGTCFIVEYVLDIILFAVIRSSA